MTLFDNIRALDFAYIYALVDQLVRDKPGLFTTAGLLAFAFAAVRYAASPWRRLPPGPRGLPVLGAAHLLGSRSWLHDECPKYGPIVHVNAAGTPAIVLNTHRAASAILDRGSAHSGRPRAGFVVCHEILSGGLFFPFEPNTPRWARMRRATAAAFGPAAARTYNTMHSEEAARLALHLASSDPGDFTQHFRRFIGSLMLAITYDRPADGVNPIEDERVLADAYKFSMMAEAALVPGAHLVELFHWLLAVPHSLSPWKRKALEQHAWAHGFFTEMLDNVKKRMEKGTARSCLATTIIEERDKLELSEKEAIWTAGITYIVGADTSVQVLHWWALAMVAHPAAQARAQAELDAIIGHARAPRVADLPHLPYVAALVREVMRWRTGLPTGLPHATEEEMWFDGYYVPKGALVIANVNACNHDTEVYGSDAASFDAMRHLEPFDDSKEVGPLGPFMLKSAPPTTKDEGHVGFGFGRRICVGRHVADDALFAAIATALWAFELEPVGEVDVEGFEDRGFQVMPKPFKCKFKPRFPEAIGILTEQLQTEGR